MLTGANLGILYYSAVITILLLLCNSFDRRHETRPVKLMSALLWMNLALLVCCLVTWHLEGRPQYMAVNYLFTCGKCGLGYPMGAMYTLYVADNIRDHQPISAGLVYGILAVCFLAFALNVVSVFNKMYFSCEGGVYSRGPLFLLNEAFSVPVLVSDMYLLFRHRKVLGKRTVLSLTSYGILPLLAAWVQIPFQQLDVMSFATTLSILIIYASIHVTRGVLLAEKENELTESRVSMMLSQIQPHFLYNALAVIQDMCHDKAPEAEQAIIAFAEYLRANMDSLGQKSVIPFKRELMHTKNYLKLEKKRFGNVLKVVYDIRTEDFYLPPLTLEPIAENAVRYGIMHRENGGTLTITVQETEQAYMITVADDGVGYDPAVQKQDGRSHIGIANVRSRLQTICGGDLIIRSHPGIGTTADIVIPKNKETGDLKDDHNHG